MNWWQHNGAGGGVTFGTQKSNELNGGVTKNHSAKYGRISVKKSEASAKLAGRKGQQGESKSVQILIIPEKTSEDQLRIDEKFRQWSKVLLYPKTVSTFVAILKEICQHFRYTDRDYIGDPYEIQLLQSRLQTHVLINGGKTMENILLAWRVFYKVSCCISNEEAGDMFVQRKYSEAIYGMLFSGTNFYLRYSAATLRSICVENLATTSVMDTQNLESLLKVINLSDCDMSETLWSIVCRFLSSNVEREREIVLLLFMHLLKDELYVKSVILPKILDTLDWRSSAIKYDLLTIVLAKFSYPSLVQCSHLENFLKPEMFVNGLLVSLSDATVLPHSAKLLKVFVKQTGALINGFIVRLLKTGSSLEIGRLTTYFARHLDLMEIYKSLELERLSSHDLQNGVNFDFLCDRHFQKLALIRRLFHAIFAQHPDLEAIDSFINLNCSQQQDLVVRQQVLEIWKQNIESNTRNFGQSINYIAEFISQNALVVESSFHSYLLDQIPHFLKYFIANVPILVNGKKLNVNQLHLVDIILKFETLYLDGRYVQEQQIAVQLTIFMEFLKFMGDKNSNSAFIYGHLKYPKYAELRARMEYTVQTLLVHENPVVQKLAMEVAKQQVDTSEEEFRQVETMCLDSIADNGNICKTRLYTNQMLAMVARNKRLSGSLVKFAENVFQTFSYSETLSPAPIVCLQEMCLENTEVREQLDKLNAVARIQGAVMTSMLLLGYNMNGINGKSVNGKTRANGTKNGLKNGQSKVCSMELFRFLKVTVDFLASLVSYSLDTQLSSGSFKTVISTLKSIFLRCTDEEVLSAARSGLGKIIASLTQCWTEKLYAFDDRTLYDELMDLIKTELIDPATENVGKLTWHGAENACAIIVAITTHDLSHECYFFDYILNKILSESANNQQQHHIYRRQLLALIKHRKFCEKDRYGLDMVLSYVLELFANNIGEMRDELLSAVLERLAQPDVRICLDEFPATYPKTWNYITDKANRHVMLDQAIAMVFSNFRSNPLIEQNAHKSTFEPIKSLESQIILEPRTQELRNLPGYIESLFAKLFVATDNALRKAYLIAINWCTKQYLDRGKFVFFDNDNLVLSQLRNTFEASFTKLDDWPLDLRSMLLDTLVAFGFTPSDKFMFEVLFNSTSSRPTTVDRVQWLNKISRLLNDVIEIKKKQ